MATINVLSTELKNKNNELQGILEQIQKLAIEDSNLFNSISGNIKSDVMVGTLSSYINYCNKVYNDTSNLLTKLIGFLNTQINLYGQANTEAAEYLDEVGKILEGL